MRRGKKGIPIEWLNTTRSVYTEHVTEREEDNNNIHGSPTPLSVSLPILGSPAAVEWIATKVTRREYYNVLSLVKRIPYIILYYIDAVYEVYHNNIMLSSSRRAPRIQCVTYCKNNKKKK